MLSKARVPRSHVVHHYISCCACRARVHLHTPADAHTHAHTYTHAWLCPMSSICWASLEVSSLIGEGWFVPTRLQPYFFVPGDVQNAQAADSAGTRVLGVRGTGGQNLGTCISAVRSHWCLVGEESACNAGNPRQVCTLSQEDPLEEDLQCSCLETLMDRGAWWAMAHGVANSQTWLSNWAPTKVCVARNAFCWDSGNHIAPAPKAELSRLYNNIRIN